MGTEPFTIVASTYCELLKIHKHQLGPVLGTFGRDVEVVLKSMAVPSPSEQEILELFKTRERDEKTRRVVMNELLGREDAV